MTKFEVIVSLLAGMLAALAVLASGLRWIYRQGMSSQVMVNALNDNTQANDKLSKAFLLYTEKADGALLDHEKRITTMEARNRRG